MRMRYVFNRVRFALIDFAEDLILGAERRDTGSFSFRDAPLEQWTPSLELKQHPSLDGLFAQRKALTREKIDELLKIGEVQSYRPYEWSQRQLAPLLLGEIEDDLRNLEVFDNLAPEYWKKHALEGLPTFGGKPRFAQFQILEAGTPVLPHIDAAEPRADVVATYTLRGSAKVRVGAVQFDMGPGDLYFIRDDARWKVKHEVLPPTEDRVSITIRYITCSQ